MTKFIPSCSPLSPSSTSSPYFTQNLRTFIGPMYGYFVNTSTFPCCSYDTTPLAFSHFSGVSCAALTVSYLPTSNSRKLTYISSALYQIWLSSKMIWLPSIVLFHWEIRAEISGTPSMVLNSTTYPNLSVTAVNGDMTCGLQFLCTPCFLPWKQFLLPLGLWQHLSSLLWLAS